MPRVVRGNKTKYLWIPPDTLAEAQARRYDMIDDINTIKRDLNVLQIMLKDSITELKLLNKFIREADVEHTEIPDAEQLGEVGS